jgi:glyoxylase-like metal-dependent hydrolase (beta-lactamase superfamily II)
MKNNFKCIKTILFILGISFLGTSCSSISMPQPTRELISGIYSIRNTRNNIPFVNFFLIKFDTGYIAIDAGFDIIQTENELNKLSISANDVVAVFITHSHFDHIGSISLFKNATIFTGNTENAEFPDIPHIIMSDGEIIQISNISIQSIYTPGHTSDSVSFLINGRYLFVGDSLVNHQNNYDNEMRRISIEKLSNIEGIEYIFTSHHGFTRNISRLLSR